MSNLKSGSVETGHFCALKLTEGPVVAKGKAPSPGSAVSEKVRTRLEELDDLEEVSVFNIQMCI